MSNEQAKQEAPIVARAGSYYRNARYIMFAIIVAMGLWFLYDGFVSYPEANRQYKEVSDQIEKLDIQRMQADREGRKFADQSELDRLIYKRKQDMQKHDEFSIGLQKLLGFLLPPVGIGLLTYWLRKSRGEIRLENGVLTAPGSPAIPLDRIDELDKELWDKKGIAQVFYTLQDGQTGKLRLDDFIYQARPIREMVKLIEEELKTQDQIIATIKSKEQEATPKAS